MSEHQPRPSRVFHIAPKLSYTDLGIPRDAKGKQLSSALSSHSVSATVMQNVYLNASELQAGVPFGDIERSGDFVSIHHGQRLTGQHAIRRSFGSTLASVAFGAEWNLDRPEFVYMSGYVYQLAYQQAATYVAAQIERRKLTVAPTAEVENAKQAAIAEMEKRRKAQASNWSKKAAIMQVLYNDKTNSIEDICKKLNISHSTLYRYIKVDRHIIVTRKENVSRDESKKT